MARLSCSFSEQVEDGDGKLSISMTVHLREILPSNNAQSNIHKCGQQIIDKVCALNQMRRLLQRIEGNERKKVLRLFSFTQLSIHVIKITRLQSLLHSAQQLLSSSVSILSTILLHNTNK